MSVLYLVDISHVIYPLFYVRPSMTRPSDNHPVGAVYGVCEYLWRLSQENPSHVAVVYDAPGGSKARKEVFPDYKANRKPVADDLKCQFPLVRQAADAFGFSRVEVDGHESDDIIATYCRLAGHYGREVVIVSSDKDLMQLVAWGDGVAAPISMYDPKKQLTITPDQVKERWGVRPDQMADLLALMGDDSDNVPGVAGVGPKHAASLINEFGSVDGVLANVASIKRNAVRSAMQAHGWKARISRRLVVLDAHVPVEADIEEFAYCGLDHRKVLEFLDEMELVTLRDEIAQAAKLAA